MARTKQDYLDYAARINGWAWARYLIFNYDQLKGQWIMKTPFNSDMAIGSAFPYALMNICGESFRKLAESYREYWNNQTKDEILDRLETFCNENNITTFNRSKYNN